MIDDEELEEYEMPPNFEAILAEEEMSHKNTTACMGLLWAPKPFSQRTGRTRRAFDIPLVAPWFKERCNPQYPVKVRVSY